MAGRGSKGSVKGPSARRRWYIVIKRMRLMAPTPMTSAPRMAVLCLFDRLT